jgi:hypothetical protein
MLVLTVLFTALFIHWFFFPIDLIVKTDISTALDGKKILITGASQVEGN